MKRILQGFFVALVLFSLVQCAGERSKPAPQYEQISPVAVKFKPLPVSAIEPQGWLKAQVEMDLDGFVGNLDSLVPELIIKDDIYGKNRLTKSVKSKDVGAVAEAGDWQVQFLWWNSETQSNWWDGFIRDAIISRNPAQLAKAEAYVRRILSTQDVDGYLGIYDRDLRYKFDNENGELWSKATLLRGLLAWYEYSEDKKVFDAIERAVENVMENYPAFASHPFLSRKPDVGGLSHGLAITDVFEHMHRLTDREDFNQYCLFLYADFSEQTLNEDAQYKKLLDTSIPLKGHGVHTYEHLRSLTAAYYASGNPSLKTALNNFLRKIERSTLPSGGPVGDEWIAGRQADATNTGYEYCSIHELMHSYANLLAKFGDATFGDKAERLFFNAALGARNPVHNGVAYLKTDNSFAMTGKKNFDSLPKTQTRYKYSPVHQDAAVCCVPNAGRITPYFLQSMWMQDADGVICSLLGPSTLRTEWEGTKVLIEEITEYPYSNNLKFKLTMEGDRAMKLKVRKPAWVTNVHSNRAYRSSGGFLVFDLDESAAEIDIIFDTAVQSNRVVNNERYFTYGALVYAHPIESKEVISKTYPLKGFFDYTYTAADDAVYEFVEGESVELQKDNNVQAIFRNKKTGSREKVLLVPMGKTILRQVTF